MERILKYQVKVADRTLIPIPGLIKCLKIARQKGVQPSDNLMLWALVQSECKTETPIIDIPLYIVGTGWEVSDLNEKYFVDTVFCNSFVWHIFTSNFYKQYWIK